MPRAVRCHHGVGLKKLLMSGEPTDLVQQASSRYHVHAWRVSVAVLNALSCMQLLNELKTYVTLVKRCENLEELLNSLLKRDGQIELTGFRDMLLVGREFTFA